MLEKFIQEEKKDEGKGSEPACIRIETDFIL
jgi:hypothetical protein